MSVDPERQQQQLVPPEGGVGDSFGLSGPHPVGRYASGLRDWFRQRPRLALIGEVTGLRVRAKAVYFELRDAEGAVPCSMWRGRLGSAQELPEGAIRDGAEVVVGGGPDYYPGSATASPSFSFRCTEHAPRRARGTCSPSSPRLRASSRTRACSSRSARLPRPLLPKTIGIVTGRGSAAEADLLAGLARRGWAGTRDLRPPAGPGPPRGAEDRPRRHRPGGDRRGRG